MTLTTIQLEAPYLLYIGDVPDDEHAKTAFGIRDWRPEKCAGQMRLPDCPVDLDLPDMTAEAARTAGVKTAIVGVAPTGGAIPEHWMPDLISIAKAGIDIAAGMHTKLADMPELVAAANEGGSRLVDVRVPPPGIPVGDASKRSGKRVLMVGTDCAIGKKYTALSLHRELTTRGIKTRFRATGQTGIMIAGEGMPMDSVVADFISGAAEVLTPNNDDDHWDVIEGQGSLAHPGYAAVTYGLVIGSQPDAMILCHDVERTQIIDPRKYIPIPDFDELMAEYLVAAHKTNEDSRFVGISVNTKRMSAEDRKAYLADLEQKHGLPAVDPVAGSIGPIADRLLETT